MRVRVLFFGVLKDIVGRASEDAELPAGASLGEALASYRARFPRMEEIAGTLLAARNREFADFSTRLDEGDEIAFLPPVSGGCCDADPEILDGGNYFTLTRGPIDARALAARILTGAEGAVVTFEGAARNNTDGRPTRCLDYEAYEPLALKEMARIGREIAARPEVGRIAMAHRLGRVLIGEAGVAVVVTAAHRRPAFEAALKAIDQLKKSVPVWKKEHFADGEVWAEGEWARDAMAR
jgi:molybdopterin converting factor subunit 1